MHRVEIIGVGSELLWGYTLDTNTAEIAQSLRRYVVRVVQSLRVADELDALTQAVREALARAELVVLTGGLGPTPDDITREAVARVFSSRLELDEGALSTIESFFETRGLTMPEANRKQAMRIPTAELLPNPRGTAPGWWVHQGGRSVVLLPGPPDEWRPMWTKLLPELGMEPLSRFERIFKTFGTGESQLVKRLGPLFVRDDPEVGMYAKPHGVEVVVSGTDPASATELAERVAEALSPLVWGEAQDTLPGVVVRRLRERGHTIATMESLTGGLVCSLLTDVPGASEAVLGGVVSYTLSAKSRFGVDLERLSQYGAVSVETAVAMAETARKILGADYGLSTTGVAGPDQLEGEPIGTVFTALSAPGGPLVKRWHFAPGSREVVKRRSAYAALGLYWRHT